jgi:ABC-type Fe3+-hydroxamate transport system substrate-binding protein
MTPAAGAPRIASLVPSVTELLVDLGLRPWLVARTGFCIHPREALAGVPKVGGTKDVKLDRLRALAPTHVIVNVDENERPLVEALRGFVPEVVVTHPCAPEDNLALYAQMAAHFGHLPGVRERAAQLDQALRARLQQATAAARDRPWRRVLYVIWRDPWMTVARDTYISRMLSLGRLETWPAVEGGPAGAARYPVFDWDAPWVRTLDAVWLGSEPYRFGAADVNEVQHLLRRRGAPAQVRLVDAEALSWYGSRAIAGIEYLLALG